MQSEGFPCVHFLTCSSMHTFAVYVASIFTAILLKNKTEKPFSLQDDEKNWHGRPLLHSKWLNDKDLQITDFHVNCTWLTENLLMTCLKLVHDYCINCTWIGEDLHMTCTRLKMICTLFADYFQITKCTELVHDLHMTK